MISRTPGTVVLALVLGAASFAQPATVAQKGGFKDPSFGTLHAKTNIGSAKSMDGKGRFEISFEGTLLISGYKGAPIQIQGELVQQYKDSGRTVYFGRGRCILSGQWRGAQWFGQKLDLVWYGSGVLRIRGEFDKDMNTGSFWYDDPKKATPFPTQGTMDVPVPFATRFTGGPVTPQRREKKPN